MKISSLMWAVLVLLSWNSSFAAVKLSNCIANSKAQAIQEVFWSSDINKGSGPTYELPSGQTLNNGGPVCTSDKINGLQGWTHALKAGLNPAKSVSTFNNVKSVGEFKSFLNSFGVTLNDPEKLDSAVQAFLQDHSSILVGSSKEQAVVLLASEDKKDKNAVLFWIDKK